MLRLRLSVPASDAPGAGTALLAVDGVRRLTETPAVDGSHVFAADVDADSAETLVGLLAQLGVAPDDYVLARVDAVVARAPTRLAWVEVLGEARANARPAARYLVLMAAAGVIAAEGVIDRNPILIVGAMAVSPDLLPVCAMCVALAGLRGRLLLRSAVTLVVGLLLATLAALLLTLALNAAGKLPSHFEVGQGGLGTLSSVDIDTVVVALAAGVAAILSFETRAGAAVGVAISVTTIPASAYLGVSAALGQTEASGALALLGANVGSVIVAGTATLVIQRALGRRQSVRPS